MRLLESIGLLAAMAALTALIAWTLAGPLGLLLAVVMLVFALPSAWNGAMPLRLLGARPVSEQQAPWIYQKLRTLAERAGLRHTPRLYHLPHAMPNALTTGNGEQAVIAVSDGLLRHLDERQLTGVLAHEIGHIRHGDTRLLGLGALFVRVTHSFSWVGQILILINLPMWLLGAPAMPWLPLLLLAGAPLLSRGLLAALSRGREFEADSLAARITGDPQSLAAALRRIEQAQAWRLGPFALLRGPDFLQTHPATPARIEALQAMPSEPALWLPLRETPPQPRHRPADAVPAILRAIFGSFRS